ncbi:hypothetical protein ID856_11935 [Xenorhabdus sp. 18]|uniref:hypothetical protein n=1 Tax=Xenorhabdus doucetiae TaxID=351671 RepID=UPI00198BF1FA|nr:hypothetical protein [Xenorhabdus sp. 18]MBD2797243.1 hypothetical protein [Xenorhabdus sp. 18]
MFALISKLFGRKNKNKDDYSLEFNDFLKREICRSKYIKPECCELIYNHATKKINILKNGTELTKEEKTNLKINTRVKYTTKELVSSLTDLGLSSYSFNPKLVIDDLVFSAQSKLRNAKELQKFRQKLDVKTAIYHSVDKSDCDWCIKMNNKKLSSDVDIIKLIEDNCTCSFNRAYLEPILPKN